MATMYTSVPFHCCCVNVLVKTYSVAGVGAGYSQRVAGQERLQQKVSFTYCCFWQTQTLSLSICQKRIARSPFRGTLFSTFENSILSASGLEIALQIHLQPKKLSFLVPELLSPFLCISVIITFLPTTIAC